MLVVDFINKYWILIMLGIVIVTLLITLFFIIYNYSNKPKTFKDNLYQTKTRNISITIDLEEKIVEKFYLYDQNKKQEIIPLAEFYVRFDKKNVEKLKNWLADIAVNHDFNRTRRIELVMYNANNSRHIYLVELDGYNAENKRYFLTFNDVSDSISVLRRVEKSVNLTKKEDFYNRVNERLLVCDENSNNFLVAFKIKEYEYTQRELQSSFVDLIFDNVCARILEVKSDNEIIQRGDKGVIYLFSSNIVNVKKFRKHLKNIINTCSGEYNIVTNKFSYTISLVAGYTKISENEKLTFDKTLEAEEAANAIVSKGRFSERLQFFDNNLKVEFNLKNNKLLAVEKVVTETLFSVNYIPIIDTETKTVSSYYVKIGLPHALNMSVNEFKELVKERYFRATLYSKIFSLILRHKDAYTKPFFFSFDFDDIEKVMEAYESNDNFKNIDIYFCLEFSNTTMQNNDLITIERIIAHYKKYNNVKFGINYNTLTALYLNAKIYSKADVVLLSGQLIEQSMEKYSNESLIEVYTKVASSYSQKVIGLEVTSLAYYELYKHYNVRNVGGIFLTPYIVNDKITDKFFLRSLQDIDNRTY